MGPQRHPDPEQIDQALRQLSAWPLRVAQVRSLFADAWQHRHNLTFADATYVALADHVGARLLTDDHRLANAPTLPVPVLRLPTSS
ncbi:MAG: type II toxin-antitoxin system VapC family toxin [Acidimicrobiales bacterium]